jgi:hypothetical protein
MQSPYLKSTIFLRRSTNEDYEHSSYGVKARHGDGGASGRLGARLAHLGAHSARRWGSAWTLRTMIMRNKINPQLSGNVYLIL